MIRKLLVMLILLSTGTNGQESSCNDKLIQCLNKQIDILDRYNRANNNHDDTGLVKSAFSAQLSRTLTNPASHTQLPFGKIKANVGGNLDNTGVYTAPRDGTYFFTWTILTNIAGACLTEIVLNGIKVGYANHTNSNRGSNVNKTSTQSVVLVLRKNDRVWIRMERTGTICYAVGWESFSGFEI